MTEDPMARPYTEEQVFALELDAENIARFLCGPWSPQPKWKYVDGDPDVMAALIYDALVALRNEMTMEDD